MVRRLGLVVVVLAMLMSAVALAQETERAKAAPPERPWSFYKLDITMREMDGSKVVNSRTYNIGQRVDEWGQLRVGSRLPVVTGTFTSEGKEHNQIQYFDIGLNVDSRLQEREGTLALDWRLELSSVAGQNNETASQPVVRTVKNNGQTILTPGKPVVMASVDDLSSTHKFVFEVTATKVK